MGGEFLQNHRLPQCHQAGDKEIRKLYLRHGDIEPRIQQQVDNRQASFQLCFDFLREKRSTLYLALYLILLIQRLGKKALDIFQIAGIGDEFAIDMQRKRWLVTTAVCIGTGQLGKFLMPSLSICSKTAST